MVNCAAVNCHNNCRNTKMKKPGPNKITFHKFPTNPARKDAWIRRVRRKDWTPTKDSVLCSAHFLPDAWDETNKAKFCQRKSLRKDAIPTEFDYGYGDNVGSTGKGGRPMKKKKFKPRKVIDHKMEEPCSKIPLICFCGYDANTQTELARHAKEQRCLIYRCSCCQYVTHDRSLLLYHRKTKRFRCEKCDFSAIDLDLVRGHHQHAHQKRQQQLVRVSPSAKVVHQDGVRLIRLTPMPERSGEDGVRLIKLSDVRSLAANPPMPVIKPVVKPPIPIRKPAATTVSRKRCADDACQVSRGIKSCDVCKCTCKAEEETGSPSKQVKLKYVGQLDIQDQKTKSHGYNCDKCDFSAKLGKTLATHKATVHGAKKTSKVPFQCELCDYRGACKANLAVHMSNIHSGRIFSCEHCVYRSAYRNNLVVHMQQQHSSLKDLYFSCDTCDYWSLNATGVEIHQSKSHDDMFRRKETRVISPKKKDPLASEETTQPSKDDGDIAVLPEPEMSEVLGEQAGQNDEDASWAKGSEEAEIEQNNETDSNEKTSQYSKEDDDDISEPKEKEGSKDEQESEILGKDLREEDKGSSEASSSDTEAEQKNANPDSEEKEVKESEENEAEVDEVVSTEGEAKEMEREKEDSAGDNGADLPEIFAKDSDDGMEVGDEVSEEVSGI